MIEPFESGQVRERRGERIISYGTSSYGYDIRCADEFKIFTNINSAVVDPKSFDANRFVDINADVRYFKTQYGDVDQSGFSEQFVSFTRVTGGVVLRF